MKIRSFLIRQIAYYTPYATKAPLLTNKYIKEYEIIKKKYNMSDYSKKEGTVRTLLWISASILFYFLSWYFPDKSSLPNLIFIIVAALAITIPSVFLPIRYSWKNLNSVPRTDLAWEPLTDERDELRASQQGHVLLDKGEKLKFLVFFRVPANIKDLNIKVLCDTDDVKCEVTHNLSMGIEDYPDGSGIIIKKKIIDDMISQRFEVEKTEAQEGGITPVIRFIDVTDISNSSGEEHISDSTAKSKGSELLSLKVRGS
ncbi:MAG: hypothetical protein ABEI13_00415 [Candidatus Paceibacteria bacterium]